MPNTARPADSFSDPGPPYFLSSRYDTKIIHISSDIVSRASHTHQTPQALRAHSGPVTMAMAPYRTVNSAAATATQSNAWRFVTRYAALTMPQKIADNNISIAGGKW